ncbi:venom serine protease 34-like [Hylaeus volcanicus]|uniref:venom serine protease 34-like n=1 Tax=Hylaeus volcanicus TaxID=313075 RepID=UPI0023B86A8D|nr:venom serine protease 34-like [Hylaeus volcanicus]
MTKAIWLLGWLTLLIASRHSEGQQCNYYQDMIAGTTYYVYNPSYPNYYQGSQSCIWTLRSPTRINFTCSVFELPDTPNCVGDRMAVQISPDTTQLYCGSKTFSVESESEEMIITFTAYGWTRGRFLCIARTTTVAEPCRCGWKNPSRIVGGTETGVHEFPMMAGMVDATTRRVYCGGTIISPSHVVTAAHCIVNRNITTIGVVVGEHDPYTGTDTNATVLYRVKSVIIHPEYVRELFLNDIAVVELDGKIRFSNEIGPACLPFQHSPDTFGGAYVDLLGWGSTDFGGPPSSTLQKVTVSVITNLECSAIYPTININRDTICTYGKGKDGCQMDSGGPVLWQNPTTRRVSLVGIISQGSGCGISAGVNCRVGGYVDWIASVTPNTIYCMVE